VVRKIVRGPAVFVPSADEWMHSFSWHTSGGSEAAAPDTKVQLHSTW